MSTSRRASRGRQRTEMAKIEDDTKRQVTFSKRKTGAFKKANELGVLCGANIGLIFMTEANKAYSYGNPNLDYVVNRYLSGNPPVQNQIEQLFEARRNANQRDLNLQLDRVENQLEAARKESKHWDQILEDDEDQYGCNTLKDDLTMEQLEDLKSKMEALEVNVKSYVDEKTAIHNSSIDFSFGPGNHGGGFY